jgi:hypothetical protein
MPCHKHDSYASLGPQEQMQLVEVNDNALPQTRQLCLTRTTSTSAAFRSGQLRVEKELKNDKQTINI